MQSGRSWQLAGRSRRNYCRQCLQEHVQAELAGKLAGSSSRDTCSRDMHGGRSLG